jgi:predicted N-acetyltransferase YhbS
MANSPYEYARLDVLPELEAQANSLIEEAFAYQENFKFSVDFAPLTSPDNSRNRYIVLDTANQSVVAHIGAKIRNFVWQGEAIPVVMLGGIAVKETLRGQGIFQALFERVLHELRSQCAFFVLWSDKHDLYRKWEFHLAGKQWCYRTTEKSKDLIAQRYCDLGPNDKNRIQTFYRQLINQHFFSPIRDDKDWSDIENITSSRLFLFENGYAFEGKGMDLQGIVHDTAHTKGVSGVLNELGDVGVVWSAVNETVSDEIMQDLQQVGLWHINSHPMALRKISHLVGREVNYRDGIFIADKEGVPVRLNSEELLDELFNYGKHGLLKEAIPVYIGGLDSI